MSSRCTMTTLCVLCISAPAAFSQTTVMPDDKFAWAENVGFLNWRDANATADGVRVCPRFLSGHVWCENVGWVDTGDGTPADAAHYANLDHTDFGVNIDVNGDLYGLAWGENIGWINFDTRAALSAFNQHARYDDASRRFRGYAWGENVGWINLDDADIFVANACIADFNFDDTANGIDVGLFLSNYSQANPQADINCDGLVNGIDVGLFLAAYSAGC